jgi:hypothetical protein
VKYENFDGEKAKERYLKKADEFDLLIMGNLSNSYLFEKMIGKKGLNIMEKSKTSIFIG